MLMALLVLLRSIGLICRGHRAVALENLALRQQLAVFKRTVRRPQLRHRDLCNRAEAVRQVQAPRRHRFSSPGTFLTSFDVSRKLN